MTSVVSAHWTSSANSAVYTTAADWTPTGVPTFSAATEFDVFIGGSLTTGTANFTVTSASNEQVGYLYIGANATIAISSGLFIIDSHVNPYSNLANYGKITVAAGSGLRFGAAGNPSNYTAAISNFGSITIAGSMAVASPFFGLYGAGTLTLSGSIVGANTGSSTYFVNVNSTIQGSGALGNSALLQLTNAYGAIIDANATIAMTINTGSNQIHNEGIMETTGSGGLIIRSNMQLDGFLKATKGTISLIGADAGGGGQATVAAGAAIALNNGQLTLGGAITIAAGGAIRTTTGNTTGVGSSNALVGDALSDGEIEDAGSIVIANNSTLNLNASVYSSGVLSLAATTGPTKLEVYGNGLSFYNAGGVVMSNSAQNSIVSNGVGDTITFNTRLRGAGTIGDGWLRVVNHLGSTITANDATSLIIKADSSAVAASSESENYNDGTIINTGAGGIVLSGGTLGNAGYLIEDGTGALTLQSNMIDSGGGIVRALKGTIVLTGDSQIFNQTEVSLAVGTILQTTSGDTDAIFDSVFNSGTINVTGGSTLLVDGHWSNAAALNVGSASTSATVEIDANNTWQLFGGGTVDMANAADKIVSAGAGARIEVRSNLISGGGTIGDADTEVDVMNGGKVDATLASGLTMTATSENQSTGQTFLYNAGIIQSDSAGGVTLNAAIYSPGQLIVDAGDKIVANFDVYGAGLTTINGTGSVEFHGEADNAISFAGAGGGSLILDRSTSFFSDIFGMTVDDSIDLRDFGFVPSQTKEDTTTSAFGPDGGVLYVTNGSSDSTPIYLHGDYTSATLAADHLAFQFTSDGHVISGSTDGTLVKLVSTA